MRLGFAPSTAGILDLDDAFRLAVRLGLEFVELAWDLQELEPRLQPADRVRELTAATGVGTTVHLPFVDLNLASLMPGVRENSVRRVSAGLEYATAVSASVGVLHTGLVPARHPRILAPAAVALDRSLKELGCLVPVGLENLALTAHDLLRGSEALARVSGAEGYGNTLDFGHAFVEGYTTEPAEDLGPGGREAGEARLRSYRSGLGRILHLHLHDNDGTADQHRALGQGRIDWASHAGFLSGFDGTACLEIAGGEAALTRSVEFLRDLLG